MEIFMSIAEAQLRGATSDAPGFAIFPDEVAGWNAMVGLLSSDSYQKLTIEGALNRYALRLKTMWKII
jgi:hypothetical protein